MNQFCPECGQPLLPPGVEKRPNEYDHAQGCSRTVDESRVYVIAQNLAAVYTGLRVLTPFFNYAAAEAAFNERLSPEQQRDSKIFQIVAFPVAESDFL